MHELSVEELKTILRWFRCYVEVEGAYQHDDDLAEAIEAVLAEKEELALIDMNDCAGGACKL